ncbi:MAG: bifunctional serine/threonine-protein kinase/formylglycine-generating enzyme family protein [Planctomycetota bacterium]
MNPEASPPDLPDAVSDRLLRVLYGPPAERSAGVLALQREFPELAELIAQHVAFADALAASAETVLTDSRPSRPKRRRWALSPGTKFGGYRIDSFLGSGGMGSVYAAVRVADARRVALKVLHADILEQPDARLRFDREATALSGLQHPGISEPLDRGEIEGCPFLAMRRIDGPTLADRIDEARRQDENGYSLSYLLEPGAVDQLLAGAAFRVDRHVAAVVRMLERLAEALGAAHQAGVVHRDIKPGNVLLERGVWPVVVDFGLASQELAATLTATGDLIGTPAYMAPEQIAATGRGADPRIDIYALGALAYECLTGRPPFLALSQAELLDAVRSAAVVPVRDLNPAVPLALETVVLTAMSREPAARYATASELIDDLVRVRKGQRILARRGAWWRLARSWLRRNRGVVQVGTTAMACAITLLAMTLAVRASRRDADLLASAAWVEAARSEEQLLWPAVPANEAKFVRWLERFGSATAEDSLVARLQRLEAECRISALPWLREIDARTRVAEAEHASDELAALSRLMAASGEGAQPADVVAAFRERRTEWLKAGKLSISTAARMPLGADAPTDPRLTSLQTALEAGGRYVLDGGEIEGRPGAIQRVASGLSWLRIVERRTVEEPRAAWLRVREDLAVASGPYREAIDLPPQLGLVPLGRDPQSGLHEFAFLRSGQVPQRGPDGQLAMSPDMAMILVLLPAGDATFGSDKRRIFADWLALPPRAVALAPFFLAKFEMTQHQWRELGGGDASQFAAGTTFSGVSFGPLQPIESVSRDEAREVLRWHGLALPTEVQWEYAARVGSPLPDPDFGKPDRDNTATERWHRPTPPFAADDYHDGHLLPTPIGTLRGNAWGIFDLGGNVSEWCDDRFGAYVVPARPGDGRRLTSLGDLAVARGGNFALSGEVHHRVPMPPDLRLVLVGLRAARAID